MVYLIDFGICSTYLNPDKTHILPDFNSGYKGTIAFSSRKMGALSSNHILFRLKIL